MTHWLLSHLLIIVHKARANLILGLHRFWRVIVGKFCSVWEIFSCGIDLTIVKLILYLSLIIFDDFVLLTLECTLDLLSFYRRILTIVSCSLTDWVGFSHLYHRVFN